MKFALSCYSKNENYPKAIIGHVLEIMELQQKTHYSEDTLSTILELLRMALESFPSETLTIQKLPTLVGYFNESMKKNLAISLLIGLGKLQKRISDDDIKNQILTLLSPIIEQEIIIEEKPEFVDLQINLSKITHMMEYQNPQKDFNYIMSIMELFTKGGNIRMKYTFPALICELYNLGNRIYIKHSKDKEIIAFQLAVFQYAYYLIESIVPITLKTSYNLFLQGVLALNSIGFKNDDTEKLLIKYLSRAFDMYQENFKKSEFKSKTLILIIGVLERINSSSEEKLIDFIDKALEYIITFDTIEEQFNGVLLCSHAYMKYPKVNFNLL